MSIFPRRDVYALGVVLRSFFVCICLVCLWSLWACSGWVKKKDLERPPVPLEKQSFRWNGLTFIAVDEGQVPDLTVFSKDALKRTASSNLAFLEVAIKQKNGTEEKALFPWFIKSNKVLLQLIDEVQQEGLQDFNAALRQRFTFYRLQIPVNQPETTMAPGSVLVTGYFQPELSASYSRTEQYTYPIYAPPPDLVQVDLQDFDKTLPAKTIFGRVVGNRLTPYYTRAEIEQGALPMNTPVLAWLASPVQGLMLHIQGSGILVFPNGDRRFVHYAANNGHSYRSVGAWLVEHGILPLEQVSWQSIEAWAKANPERFLQASFTNPRYIFFRFEEDGPLGVTGRRLEPRYSIALDREIYGLGGLFLLYIEGFEGEPFASLVFHQDVGSAIQGPHRVDLYVGEGYEAGELAGKLKNMGRLFLLLSKDDPND